MNKDNVEREVETSQPASFFGGLLFGGFISAVIMLLFVHQSGEKTRDQIQHKVIELRDQTVATVEDAVAQVRTSAGHIKDEVSDKVMEFKKQGQDVLVEQLDRVSDAADSGKKAIQNA